MYRNKACKYLYVQSWSSELIWNLANDMEKQNKKHQSARFIDKKLKTRVWCSLFHFFMWFARFQILICEPQSIWRKLLVLSWIYIWEKFDVHTQRLKKPFLTGYSIYSNEVITNFSGAIDVKYCQMAIRLFWYIHGSSGANTYLDLLVRQ